MFMRFIYGIASLASIIELISIWFLEADFDIYYISIWGIFFAVMMVINAITPIANKNK